MTSPPLSVHCPVLEICEQKAPRRAFQKKVNNSDENIQKRNSIEKAMNNTAKNEMEK